MRYAALALPERDYVIYVANFNQLRAIARVANYYTSFLPPLMLVCTFKPLCPTRAHHPVLEWAGSGHKFPLKVE